MADWYTRVTEREKDFSELWSRMDDDKKLYLLNAFVFKDDKGEPIQEDLDVLTDNGPLVFAQQVINTLASANMQTVVTGNKLKDKDTTFIEDFYKDFYLAVDDRMRFRGIVGLFNFLVEQVCIRGGVATRCLLRMDGDKFVPDILPWDIRFMAYEYATDGFEWKSYTTMRTKDMILTEYPEVPPDKLRSSNRIEVRDIWSRDTNIIYVDAVKAREQKHKYGEVPVISLMSGAGTMIQDDDAYMHQGESIYWANRGLYPEFNKMASILHSLNVGSFFGGLQYESEAGTGAAKPQRPPYGKRFTVPVEKGGGYKPMPREDIKQATQLLFSLLSASIQRGALPNVDYGSLQFPLSAVAISKLSANKDKIYLPRIQALSLFYRYLSMMVKDQYIKLKVTADLGGAGERTSYPYTAIEGDFNISYKFFASSSEQDIANLSVAQSAGNLVSDDYKRREILKLEDPDGEKRKIDLETAFALVPELRVLNWARAIEDDEDEAALKIITEKLGITLQQLRQGRIVGVDDTQKVRKPGNGPLPMMSLLEEPTRRMTPPGQEPMPEPQMEEVEV